MPPVEPFPITRFLWRALSLSMFVAWQALVQFLRLFYLLPMPLKLVVCAGVFFYWSTWE